MRHLARLLLSATVLLGLTAVPAFSQCVSLTTSGVATNQSFNTLSSTAGSTTNNLTITGWFLTETGGGARDNEQYAVDTGGSNTGDTYSYGAAGNSDRALGGLQSGTLIPVIGACFTNNTGGTISSLSIAYTGEQWRIGNTAAARDDRLDFQYSTNATSLTTGTWTDVDALDFVNPIKTAGTAGALDGNAAANRTAISSTVPSLSIANGATFWIRWNDLNASGADDGLAVDDFSLTPNGGPAVPNLSINDVTLAEGDSGTTTFTFTVSLSSPAGPGGVTFDIATADNTATTADNDYVAQSLTGQTIPAGSSTYAFNVTVNGDTTVEANQTFFVNVTNVTGANVTDGQGTGTISNDDVAVTPIHDIQGPGSSSPIVGASVTTRGVVTGVKNNGFFIQEPDATVDADPATSEGVFVFTSSAPPAAAAVGNYVQVTATVIEFVPSQDPLQPPLTELSSPTVVLLSSPPAAPPLPSVVPLSASFPDPAGPVDQLERVEGMRVSVASLTVTGPTLGNVNEANATATSTGVFFGVVTGVARPFREEGIQAPDPAPSGSIPPIPRWDANPELLRVDSDGIGAAILDVGTGAVVTGLTGPLDYTFRRYTILPEPAVPFSASGGPTAVAVTPPTSQEFTVSSFNVERFFDTANDPAIGEPVLTATAYQNRLEKASRIIRNYLRTPDILGMVEVENLAALQDLADQINADAVTAGDPDPQYDAYLVEGNDVGGIDVGFLVKTAPVAGATPRVEVVEVQQELDGTLVVNPDSSTETLNDRPPLRLNAIVHNANGASFPVTVIVNHMRSLNDVDDPTAPGPNGWATLGDRVRNKRQKQAEDLANLVQSRQTADPAERIILVGDFNAFEFNDGFTDSMGTIEGTPAPDNETAVPGDGVDLVNPDLDNLFDTAPAAERYSFIFDGNAQSLDHAVINEDLIAATVAQRLEHPRVNADFPQVARNDASSSTRLADHDPLVAYFQVAAFATAGVSLTKMESTDPVTAGGILTYSLMVTNGGPDTATGVSVSDPLPAGTTFSAVTAPAGWSCTTPAVGANGTVTCLVASLANGDSAAIDIDVTVGSGVAAGTVLSNTATVTTTSLDSNPADNSDTVTTTVTQLSDYSLTMTDTPDPVFPGDDLTYSLTAANAGPGTITAVELSDVLPAGTTFQSLSAPAGWTCTTPAVGANGTVSCSIASLGVESDVFTLVVQVGAGVSAGTILVNNAFLVSETPDSNPEDTQATNETTVLSPATVTGTKTASGAFSPNSTVTYTIVLSNSSKYPQSDNSGDELTDVLPSSLLLVSASATSGTAAANVGTNTVTWNGSIPGGGSVTVTIQATILTGLPSGTTVSNQGSISYDADGDGTNEATALTDDPGVGGAVDPTTFDVVFSPAAVTGTKAVGGTLRPGSTVVYTVVLSNTGTGTQLDNPGNEFTDVLPASLALVSASATSGTASATVATNTVTWNGSIPASGTVTITIQATVLAGVAPGTVISNQGSFSFDADGNGTNEAGGVTDDPGAGGASDPTTFTVTAAPAVTEIPTLGEWAMILMTLLLAMGGAWSLRRMG